MFYGCYWWRFDTQAHQRFGDGSWRLGTAEMRWFWRIIWATGRPGNPLAEPIEADLRGLPPLLLTAAALIRCTTTRWSSTGGSRRPAPRTGSTSTRGWSTASCRCTPRCEAARDAIVEAGQAIRQMLA